MNMATINLSHIDAVARLYHSQIEQQGQKRIYTSRTLTGCDEIYQAIRSREESEAIEIRKGVGSHHTVLHPTCWTRW